MQIKWMFIITVICGAILAAGYNLAQDELTVAAAPAPIVDKAPISEQATTVEEVNARPSMPQPAQAPTVVDRVFGFSISYPNAWDKTELSSNVIMFHSFDGATQVKVEIASVLPADGLSAFVGRSLGDNILLTRHSLTIHGLPAERVQVYSDQSDGQITQFYIAADELVYLISGAGEQRPIETVARSFNAPLSLAQR